MVCDNAQSNKYESKHKKINLLNLLKSKNIKIVFLVLIVIIAFVLYLKMGSDNEKESLNIVNEKVYTSTMEYSLDLEQRLESLLSQIDGAGKVKVMVSLDGSPELVYASDTDSKTTTNSNGTTVTSNSSSLILVSQSGKNDALILKENLPSVKGVIVVSSGASNIGVKMDILNSISTLLDISSDKIQIRAY